MQGGYDMVMYGDSLTDGWTWSTRGLAAFQKYFGKYRVLNAGITGVARHSPPTARPYFKCTTPLRPRHASDVVLLPCALIDNLIGHHVRTWATGIRRTAAGLQRVARQLHWAGAQSSMNQYRWQRRYLVCGVCGRSQKYPNTRRVPLQVSNPARSCGASSTAASWRGSIGRAWCT